MMTSEFLAQLARALNKKKIADANEIVDEYAQHFACSWRTAIRKRKSRRS